MQSHLKINLMLAVLYLATGWFCLAFLTQTGQWPLAFLPAGFSMVMMLKYGVRATLPGLLLAGIAVFWMPPAEQGLWVAVYLSAVIALQSWLGVVLLRRFVSQRLTMQLDQEILRWLVVIAVVAIVSMLLSTPVTLIQTSDHLSMRLLSWAAGQLIGLLLIMPLSLLVIGKPRALWRSRAPWLAITFVVGLVATILLSGWVKNYEDQEIGDRFIKRTQEFATLFRVTLSAQELVQDSVAQLFATSDHVNRQEFRQFVRWATERTPNIQVLEWLPRIEREQREAYEREQQQYFGPDFTITDIEPGNVLVPAKPRQSYYPITYLEPEAGNERAQGFDPTSSAVSVKSIYKSFEAGHAIARPPLVMVRENFSKRVLMLYRPVYQLEDGSYTLDENVGRVGGMVNMAIRSDDMVRQVLSQNEFRELNLRWRDVLTGDYYFNETADVDTTQIPFEHTLDMTIAGREMSLIFSPTVEFIQSNRSHESRLVLLGGLMLTALFSLLFLSMTGRTYQIAREVRVRTEELTHAKEIAVQSEHKLRETFDDMQRTQASLRLSDAAFNAASEGFVITDNQSNVIAINHAFEQITGYQRSEVIRRHPVIFSKALNPAGLFDEMWQLLNERGMWRGEMLCKRKDGTLFSAYLAMSVVRGERHEIEHYVAVFSDISENKKAQLTIEHQANYDLLTGLPNRRLFNDRLQQAIRASRRDKTKVCLMFLDLDRFKDVNDTMGHDVGDELLSLMAQRIAACLREVDTVARLGGDEFTILLSDFDNRLEAVQVAQKLITAIEKPLKINQKTIRASTSIGVTFYPDDGADAGLLVQNADRAMYAAKEMGGSTYAFYSSELELSWNSRKFILDELEHALDHGHLKVFYQPIMAASGGIVVAEALVRWQHPERGLISPGDFLPVAERMGFIDKLDDYVFTEVCQQIKIWQSLGLDHFRVAVNRSAKGFGPQEGRLDWIKFMTGYEIDSSKITLEITESVLMQRQMESRDLLRNLRNFGVRISIDDFGTGYSSLAYLKQLDVDFLKIDQSFVRDLEIDDNDRAIIEAIIVMAKRLDIRVVAEGVETASQRDILIELGCDFLQGYLFAKPMPADEFTRYLASSHAPDD